MADTRYFAKLDVGYFDNPKTADLLELHPRALILHLRAIAYCRQHQLDGRFPIRQVVRLACASYCGSQCGSQCQPECGSQCDGQCGTKCDFCLVVDAGLFVRIDDRTAAVHDYLEHQDSPDQIKRRKDAAKRGADARWASPNDADRNAERNAKGIADSNATRNAEERRGEEIHTPTSRKRSGAAVPEPEKFAEFYKLYPRKKDPADARKAWARALKKTDPDTIINALREQLPEIHMQKRPDGDFRKLPATWLNKESWLNEPDVAQQRDPRIPEGW